MDYVIALGGSIICPGKIDTSFLRSFYFLIVERIKKGDRFVIIAGGGDIARKYQEADLIINGVEDKQRDWIGIYATYLNAHLIKAIFKKYVESEVVSSRDEIDPFKEGKVIVGSGWTPGRSTDYVATATATDLDIENILILSNQDYIYDKNPEEAEDAKPVKEFTWGQYRKIIPDKWSPGLKSPVDPIASRLADKENKKVVVANGRNLKNLKRILESKKFKGTTIVN